MPAGRLRKEPRLYMLELRLRNFHQRKPEAFDVLCNRAPRDASANSSRYARTRAIRYASDSEGCCATRSASDS